MIRSALERMVSLFGGPKYMDERDEAVEAALVALKSAPDHSAIRSLRVLVESADHYGSSDPIKLEVEDARAILVMLGDHERATALLEERAQAVECFTAAWVRPCCNKTLEYAAKIVRNSTPPDNEPEQPEPFNITGVLQKLRAERKIKDEDPDGFNAAFPCRGCSTRLTGGDDTLTIYISAKMIGGVWCQRCCDALLGAMGSDA